MSQKRDDILLTKFDIEILKYLSDDKNKPFKKWDLYTSFKDKGNNRIDDRLKNLRRLEIIDEKKEGKYKTIKIIKISFVNTLIKFFGQSTR